MSQRLTYLRLEIKRALLRLPQLAAGAVLLLLFLGLAAGFAGERLYGDSAFGRMTIGVVLAEEDEQEKMLVQMLSHMESVESICDFQYMTEEEAEEAFQKHQICGALYLPEGLIQGIMNGSNPPIQVRLEGGGLEKRIFKELTQAGARILGAAQAGIYAGDQLLHEYEMDERIGQLEQELNEIYINNSLSRESLFQERQVSATGDLSPLQFYGASILILYLLFLAVPVSSYLKPESTVMAQKLKLLGIGAWTGTAARLAGLWILMVIGAVPFLLRPAGPEFSSGVSLHWGFWPSCVWEQLQWPCLFSRRRETAWEGSCYCFWERWSSICSPAVFCPPFFCQAR